MFITLKRRHAERGLLRHLLIVPRNVRRDGLAVKMTLHDDLHGLLVIVVSLGL